jgi:hypothetical protein
MIVTTVKVLGAYSKSGEHLTTKNTPAVHFCFGFALSPAPPACALHMAPPAPPPLDAALAAEASDAALAAEGGRRGATVPAEGPPLPEGGAGAPLEGGGLGRAAPRCPPTSEGGHAAWECFAETNQCDPTGRPPPRANGLRGEGAFPYISIGIGLYL